MRSKHKIEGRNLTLDPYIQPQTKTSTATDEDLTLDSYITATDEDLTLDPYIQPQTKTSHLITATGHARHRDRRAYLRIGPLHPRPQARSARRTGCRGQRADPPSQHPRRALLALLKRHLLSGLVDAPWVRTDDPESDDDRFFAALQELVAYAFEEGVRIKKKGGLFPGWHEIPVRRDAPGKRPGAGSAPHSLITTATTPVVVTPRAGLRALATSEWQLAATA
jgi:hypothetical protein